MIRTWWSDKVRVLTGALRVPRAQHRLTQAVTPRDGVEVIPDGVDGPVIGIMMAGSVGTGLGLVAGPVFFGELKAGLKTLLGRIPVRDGERQSREGGCQEDL